MKLVCIGNSVVRGAPGSREESFCAVLEQITDWEVINQGIEGQTTSELVARFEEDVIRHQPDMVLILNGPADFTFLGKIPEESGENFFAMANMAEEAGIFPILVTPMLTEPEVAAVKWLKGKNVDYYAVNKKLEKLREIFMAGPYSVIDLQQAYKSCMDFVDGLHPTGAGYRFIGEFLAPELNRLSQGIE